MIELAVGLLYALAASYVAQGITLRDSRPYDPYYKAVLGALWPLSLVLWLAQVAATQGRITGVTRP
jgi:hypothetical protein